MYSKEKPLEILEAYDLTKWVCPGLVDISTVRIRPRCPTTTGAMVRQRNRVGSS